MYAPHTVTVFNVVQETDPATFKDTTENNVTVLHGVFLEGSKGASARDRGTENADAATLHIPFSVKATDGTTGKAKRYVNPAEFHKAKDKSELWTLSVDRNTFFVKGEVVNADPQKQTEQQIRRMHGGVYTVTRVDEKDYGSRAMQHWEVGGI